MMTMKINDLNELEKMIQYRFSLALKFTQEEIFKVIQKNINDYYREKVFFRKTKKESNKGEVIRTAIPAVYERSYQFLNSLIRTDVTIKNGTVSCSVMIDTESLDYIQNGDIVVDMINRGYHADKSINEGEYQAIRTIETEDTHFWDDSIKELGGYNGILNIMKKNCKKVGLPIE